MSPVRGIASTFRVRAQVGRSRVSSENAVAALRSSCSPESEILNLCLFSLFSVHASTPDSRYDQVVDQATPCRLPALQCYVPVLASARAPHTKREQDCGRQNQGWNRRRNRNTGR